MPQLQNGPGSGTEQIRSQICWEAWWVFGEISPTSCSLPLVGKVFRTAEGLQSGSESFSLPSPRIVTAVSFLHGKKMVHRDIKSSSMIDVYQMSKGFALGVGTRGFCQGPGFRGSGYVGMWGDILTGLGTKRELATGSIGFKTIKAKL